MSRRDKTPQYYFKSDVQCPHLVALIGIVARQCGHSFVGAAAGATGGACIRLICLTSMKIAKATITKLMMLPRVSGYEVTGGSGDRPTSGCGRISRVRLAMRAGGRIFGSVHAVGG